MRGKRLGVISRSGGHAVIAADACELAGFELAHFPETFLREIELSRDRRPGAKPANGK
jgi:acetyltransferase